MTNSKLTNGCIIFALISGRLEVLKWLCRNNIPHCAIEGPIPHQVRKGNSKQCIDCSKEEQL